jgi:hypothetical protein
MLATLSPLKVLVVSGDLLGAYVANGVTGFLLDQRETEAARRFGEAYNCDFRFDPSSTV